MDFVAFDATLILSPSDLFCDRNANIAKHMLPDGPGNGGNKTIVGPFSDLGNDSQ